MRVELTLYAEKFVPHNQIIELPETVELFFNTTTHSIGTLTLQVENTGGLKKDYRIGKSPIDITEFFKEPGEVKCAVALSHRGKVLRTWQIEPFCAVQIQDSIEVIPAIEYLKGRVDVLEKAVTELVTLIKEN